MKPVNMKVNEGHIRKFVRAREKSKKIKILSIGNLRK